MALQISVQTSSGSSRNLVAFTAVSPDSAVSSPSSLRIGAFIRALMVEVRLAQDATIVLYSGG